eukprot:TRINITY_DN40469_c0_g1_i1.p1 TRINITY_DN40469_c0_g1~~TRINITY_DN40469_c0_g1_i1.p1  ORF type:complete len:1656 (-),score=370.61 TRINITY_DN40469_c0_g1_i1:255-5222(-)
MGAPPAAQLALLRSIVGPVLADGVLEAAWRRSGGDLAAAVNIVLDTPPPLSQPSRPTPRVTETIDLNDSDDDAPAPPAAPVRPQQRFNPAPASQRTPATSSSAVPKGTSSQQPAKKIKLEPGTSFGTSFSKPEVPTPHQRPAPVKDWSFQLGSCQIDAYSTTKVAYNQQFQHESGRMGALLETGQKLNFKHIEDTKKRAKPRPGAVSTGVTRSFGTIRFEACGMEVGKFPAAVVRTIVPLLEWKLIEVSAFVGSDPPRELSVGTTVRVELRIVLKSSALSAPSRDPGKTMAVDRSVSSDGAAGGKKKGASQAALQKHDEDREVKRNAMGQLMDLLKLRKVRGEKFQEAATDKAATSTSDAAAVAGKEEAEDGEGVDDAGEQEQEAQEDMSRQAAAQLGGREALERCDLPSVSLPEHAFKSKLRGYQGQAVYWMWQRENPTSDMPPHWLEKNSKAKKNGGPSSAEKLAKTLHPMWDEYSLRPPVTPPTPSAAPVSCLYHHRTTGALSLDFPDASLAHTRGGLLADDMGLGKTVMCLALCSLDMCNEVPSARTHAEGAYAAESAFLSGPHRLTSFFGAKKRTSTGEAARNVIGGTLVVAPLSLICQWQGEVERHCSPSARPTMLQYHGSSRHCTPAQLKTYGMVFTTFGTLSCEKEDGPLYQVYWRRIILDEAHCIKNRGSRVAQSAYRLQGYCRWCVTGTPMQNSIDELYSFVKFLQVDPWGAWPEWRKGVTLLLDKGRQGDTASMTSALDCARRIIQPMMIRRTKATKDPETGELLIQLPAKHMHVMELQLSPPERDFYDALFTNAKAQFDTFIARGDILSQYTQILQLILKLRQALCHPFLVFARSRQGDMDFETLEKKCLAEMGAGAVTEKFVGNLLQEIKEGTLSDCPICCDTPEDPAMTSCGHIFCRECAIKAIGPCKGECPVCRKPGVLDKNKLKVLPGASRFPSRLMVRAKEGNAAQEGGGDQGGVAHSTKMKELLKLLQADMDGGHRCVVFSQWTAFIDLLGNMLEGANFKWQRFDGSLSLNARQERVAWLSEKQPEDSTAGRVLLVSLKAGNVGLNLVAATRLYLLDQWWNPAVEEQAIQRVHRIGQTQEVHIYKFVVRDSIDEDILELHKAKSRLIEDLVESGAGQEVSSKLTLNDLKRMFSPCRVSLRGPKALADKTVPGSLGTSAPATEGSSAVSGAGAASCDAVPDAMDVDEPVAPARGNGSSRGGGKKIESSARTAEPKKTTVAKASVGHSVGGNTEETQPETTTSCGTSSAKAPAALVMQTASASSSSPAIAQSSASSAPALHSASVMAAPPMTPEPVLRQMTPAASAASEHSSSAVTPATARPVVVRQPLSEEDELDAMVEAGLREEDALYEMDRMDTSFVSEQTPVPASFPQAPMPVAPTMGAAPPADATETADATDEDSDVSDGEMLAALGLARPAPKSSDAGIVLPVQATQPMAPPPPVTEFRWPVAETGAAGVSSSQVPAAEAGDSEAPPMCKCSPPKPPSLLTVRKEGPNIGRQFWKCGDCNFFKWAPKGSGDGDVMASQAMAGAADASNTDDGGGATSSAQNCFKCGQAGHWARDCPTVAAAGFSSSSSAGGATSGNCFKCGQSGHWARDCPGAAAGSSSQMQRRASFGGDVCFKCGNSGHWASSCPSARRTRN